MRLKTDPRWAEFHNAREIGGFGVLWGPYGFNSGVVTQEDVARAKAVALGLIPEHVPMDAPPIGINEGLSASVRKMEPALKRKLIDELRNGPKARTPEEAAREAAANTRREMLHRGLTDAVTRGNHARAEKYRKSIAALPPGRGLAVREDGDKIVREDGEDLINS